MKRRWEITSGTCQSREINGTDKIGDCLFDNEHHRLRTLLCKRHDKTNAIITGRSLCLPRVINRNAERSGRGIINYANARRFLLLPSRRRFPAFRHTGGTTVWSHFSLAFGSIFVRKREMAGRGLIRHFRRVLRFARAS